MLNSEAYVSHYHELRNYRWTLGGFTTALIKVPQASDIYIDSTVNVGAWELLFQNKSKEIFEFC